MHRSKNIFVPLEPAVERKGYIYTSDNASKQISSTKQTYVSLTIKIPLKSHNSITIQASEQ